jgi:hypothetical protein
MNQLAPLVRTLTIELPEGAFRDDGVNLVPWTSRPATRRPAPSALS